MGVIRRLRKNDSSRGASTPTWPLITVSPFNDVVRDARRTTWRSKPRVEPGGHVSTMPHSLGKRYSPLSHIYARKPLVLLHPFEIVIIVISKQFNRNYLKKHIFHREILSIPNRSVFFSEIRLETDIYFAISFFE